MVSAARTTTIHQRKKSSSPKELWRLRNLCLSSARKYRKRPIQEIVQAHLENLPEQCEPTTEELIQLYRELEEEREREIEGQYEEFIRYENEEFEYLASLQDDSLPEPSVSHLPCPLCAAYLIQQEVQDGSTSLVPPMMTKCSNRICMFQCHGGVDQVRRGLARALQLHQNCTGTLLLTCPGGVLSAHCSQCQMSGKLL